MTDILITGHFWDPRSPAFFSKEDMKKPDFRISIIADISCDVNGPIPSTVRATTISDPFYSYNPFLETEEPAFSKLSNITVMSIDNLPGELPRDASLDFGKMLMSNVLHDLLTETTSPMIERATILRDGKLTDRYKYLDEYLNG
jgi:alanine dehydrogenase